MVNSALPKLSLEYVVRAPRVPSAKTPLLVLLHGYGSNERDLFSLERELPDELLMIWARAPKTLAPGQYAWFDIDYSSGKPVGNLEQAEDAGLMVTAFIDEVCKNFDVDPLRIFLGGFSQGAMLSLSVGLLSPELLRGILPLSGRIVPAVKERALGAPASKYPAVFLAHGTLDQVIPLRFAQEAKEVLHKLHVVTAFHEYPIAHTISDEEVEDMGKWLSMQLLQS